MKKLILTLRITAAVLSLASATPLYAQQDQAPVAPSTSGTNGGEPQCPNGRHHHGPGDGGHKHKHPAPSPSPSASEGQ